MAIIRAEFLRPFHIMEGYRQAFLDVYGEAELPPRLPTWEYHKDSAPTALHSSVYQTI